MGNKIQKTSSLHLKIIESADLVFWDFDGVIKDSVDVKASAYESLFSSYGSQLMARVKSHQLSHGGESRFEKIPLYLSWAGEEATSAKIEEFCHQFSRLVQQAVIESPWVPGVHEYLLHHANVKYFVLLTATPQKEIEEILVTLNIAQCFREVYGSPKPKRDSVREVLSRLNWESSNALLIGDSEVDMDAAQSNSVPFVLRCTPHNLSIQANYGGPIFDRLLI